MVLDEWKWVAMNMETEMGTDGKWVDVWDGWNKTNIEHIENNENTLHDIPEARP